MGGARVTTLVTLRKCTLSFKRVIKILKLVLASTKGFRRGLGLDQALQEGQGSDFVLLPPGVLVKYASRTKETGSKIPKITSENALNVPKRSSSVHRSPSQCRYP